MTIGGLHTAHELSDLLAAFQSQVTDLDNALVAAETTVDTTDPNWSAWISAYTPWLDKFNAAAAVAQNAVESGQASTLTWDVDTEEDAYQNLLTVFQNGSTPSPDGYKDFLDRFRALPNNPQGQFVMRPVPQPTAPDADLNTVNTLGNAPVVGNGGLIDQLEQKAESLTGPGTGTWWLLGAGALAALAAVTFLKRLL